MTGRSPYRWKAETDRNQNTEYRMQDAKCKMTDAGFSQIASGLPPLAITDSPVIAFATCCNNLAVLP